MLEIVGNPVCYAVRCRAEIVQISRCYYCSRRSTVIVAGDERRALISCPAGNVTAARSPAITAAVPAPAPIAPPAAAPLPPPMIAPRIVPATAAPPIFFVLLLAGDSLRRSIG